MLMIHQQSELPRRRESPMLVKSQESDLEYLDLVRGWAPEMASTVMWTTPNMFLEHKETFQNFDF